IPVLYINQYFVFLPESMDYIYTNLILEYIMNLNENIKSTSLFYSIEEFLFFKLLYLNEFIIRFHDEKLNIFLNVINSPSLNPDLALESLLMDLELDFQEN